MKPSEIHMIPVASGKVKFFGGCQVLRTSHLNVGSFDDCWNIDGSRDGQIHGQVSHNLQEKPPENKCGPREKLTKRQATSRPDHLWPEIWRSVSRNANEAETTLGP